MLLQLPTMALYLVPISWAQDKPTYPGDLTISEVQAETDEVENYYGEWVEIYNASGRNLDLTGLEIHSDDDVGVQITDTTHLPTDEYLVLGVSDDVEINGGIPVDVVYTFVDHQIQHEGDNIQLVMDGVIIDELSWDYMWSMQRDRAHQANINAYDNEWANDLKHNWCGSDQLMAGDHVLYGTPGSENLPCDESSNDADGDGYSEADGDCDDQDPLVNPGAVDGDADPYGNPDDDGDCDGDRDDGVRDDDADGYAEVDGDCDDDNPSMSPAEVEISDGIDNDCNGCIDDVDTDGDSWTDCPSEDVDCDDDGIVDIFEPRDCDEGDNLIYPCANEVPYDGVDNDCDGFDNCDVDGDGYDSEDCPDPKSSADDCDDNNAEVHPNGAEGNPDEGGQADGLDNDCNGIVDDPYLDLDGDGVATYQGDCDDEDPYTHPALHDSEGNVVIEEAVEECDDLVDNDCDGFYNEGCDNPSGYASVAGGGGCTAVALARFVGSSGLLVLMSMGVALTRRREEEGR